MARLLVIEDESILLDSIVRGLSKLAGMDVVGVGTFGDALKSIDERAPALIFSDIDLPDRSGLELIGELGRRGLSCPLTFISAYTTAFAPQIPRHAKVRVLEKPVSLEQLRELVRTQLGAPSIPPQEAPFSVADYLQIACLGRHSVVIFLGAETNPHGAIVVYGGTLWSARDASGDGGEAVMRLAFAHGHRVVVRRLAGDPGPQDVHEGWESLLMEAARRLDERARDSNPGFTAEDGFGATLAAQDASGGEGEARGSSGSSPRALEHFLSELPPPSESEPPEDLGALAFDAALDAAMHALLHKEYQDAWRALREAERLRPDDRTVAANLARLRQLGVDEPAPL